MLYLFHGSDVEKVRSKAFEWVAKAREKEPNLAYVRLSREEITSATLLDAAQSGGLFVKRLLILLDDPFPSRVTLEEGDEISESKNIVEEHLTTLAESENAIIILAPKLLATKAKKIVAKAKIEYKFDATAAREDARGFNSGLVNALGARSKEKLWMEIERALRAGDAPEMLHGLLHWKARDILEKGSRAWTEPEARKLSLSLIQLLQESRRGSLDLSESLEKFVLSI
jgi:DNA polymerase III delta subunit